MLSNARPPLTDDERRALERAAREAIEFRAGLAEASVTPACRPAEAAARIAAELPETGQPADAVLAELIEQATPGVHGHTSPRFFGYVCGGSMPVGAAADVLVTAWGQNSASSWESPSVAVIEQILCGWCLDLLDLPREAGVGIVSGATVANTQAIIAARDVLLRRQGWDCDRDGLFGAPAIPVIHSDAAHSAPLAGIRYAGLGLGRAVKLACDDQGRIRVEAVQAALAACDQPPLVILQAGQINTGASDPFADIIPLVHAAGGWVHVDGAFGLWANAVPELKPSVAGVDQADSWAVDLHKWLNAPYDAGLCITRNRADLVTAMSARGAYLPDLGETWEPSESTLELSRRARGVPSYAILRHLGREGLKQMVSRHCRLARHLAARLDGQDGITVLNDVVMNQVAIACENDERTQQVLARVQQNARVYPSHGTWLGRQIIRASIINHATERADIDLLADEILAANTDLRG